MSSLIPLRARQMGRPSRLLFIHAHPDDEAIYTGVGITHQVDKGDTVYVVMCTRGERGGVIAPEIQDLEVDAPHQFNPQQNSDPSGNRLGEIKTVEFRQSNKILGVEGYFFLGDEYLHDPMIGPRRYKDSGKSFDTYGRHEALDNPYRMGLRPGEKIFAPKNDLTESETVLQEAIQLAYIIRHLRPEAVITHSTLDNSHPDQKRAGVITHKALEYSSMSIDKLDAFGFSLDAPPWTVEYEYHIKNNEIFNVDPQSLASVKIKGSARQFARKKEAIATYGSHIEVRDRDNMYAFADRKWYPIQRTEQYALVRYNGSKKVPLKSSYKQNQLDYGTSLDS